MAIRDAGAIDKNFLIEKSISREGLTFYSAEGLSLHGLMLVDGKYRRMPEEDARRVNEKVFMISTESAGGRVRFRTDSGRIAIYAEYHSVARVSNYSLSATMGFDIYSGERFVGVFIPPIDAKDSYESIISSPHLDGLIHEYTINFPISSEVRALFIGVDDGSVMLPAEEYKINTPIVYYGSSTTQGACASHPGMAYPNIISRRLNCDFLNLAFWGNAKGECEMAEYIAGLDMSALVYDYDYNAPSLEHLKATHERMFKIIREAQPELPIIILSGPKPYPRDVDLERERVIRGTYERAREDGDRNVYFLSGREILSPVRDLCLADNIHPSDVGFLRLADGLCEIIKGII